MNFESHDVQNSIGLLEAKIEMNQAVNKLYQVCDKFFEVNGMLKWSITVGSLHGKQVSYRNIFWRQSFRKRGSFGSNMLED
jgi:hypothetical protein